MALACAGREITLRILAESAKKVLRAFAEEFGGGPGQCVIAGSTRRRMTSVEESHYTQEVPIPLPPLDRIQHYKIAIIRTSWNADLLEPLVAATVKRLQELGVPKANIGAPVIVPGAFEIPFVAKMLATKKEVHCIICFGLLIKAHFEYISNAASTGLMQAQLETGVPMIYGVLNCLTREQAVNRCGPNSQLPNSLAHTTLNMCSVKTGVFLTETK